MSAARLICRVRPALDGHPRPRAFLRGLDESLSRWHHGLARAVPAVIRPEPRQLTVAVTAACNLRCLGCRYGRDFMVGERLSIEVLRDVIDDAAGAGIHRVRFYGGEPLLHPDLPEAIRRARERGMDPYVTTNGLLLGKRIDELYHAGLRWLTMGFYGVGAAYDEYTQREGHYERL